MNEAIAADGSAPAGTVDRQAAFAAPQALVLERIASGAPLPEVLHALVSALESPAHGMFGSLLLLDADGRHLRHGAAPSLPPAYCRALDGVAIGPRAGSCGTAAYTGQPVIVSDIATDPLWDDYRALALPHGLRACWSQPVHARDGAVLGTFATYYRVPRGPTAAERAVLEGAAHVASIAIEWARADHALREREASFRLLFAVSPLPMWVHDLEDLRILEANDAASAQYGYPREELLGLGVADLCRPEGGPTLPADTLAVPEAGVWRHRRKDGGVIDVKVVAHPLTFRGRQAVLVVAEEVGDPRRREERHAALARLDRDLAEAATADEAGRAATACAEALWGPGSVAVPSRGGRAPGELNVRRGDGRLFDEDDRHAAERLAGRYGEALDRIEAEESRRRAEAAVRESEARFRSVFERAGAGLALGDWEGRWVLVNPAFCRFLGYEAAELVGHSTLDVTHPDDHPLTTRHLEEGNAGVRRVIDLEKRYVRKDGAIVWGHLSAVELPAQPGERPMRFAIIQDVTERKRAEEALRESEARYRTLFETSMDAIFMADREGRVLEANPATLALFGVSQDDLPGLRIGDLHAGGSAAHAFLRTIVARGAVQDYEVTMRRRDGTPMDCIVTARARRDAAGRVVRYEGIIRDVTAQRAAERGLRDLSAHLLRVQDEERRRLARELHDSTGQDLAALAMNLAVARQDGAAGPRGQKALADSQEIVDRCARGLRTLSYLLHPPLLDEMGLVAALRWLGEGFQERSGIRLTLTLPDDLGRLGHEMETALFRIAQEALNNVRRHSGGTSASVRLGREGRRVRLEIEDDGPAPLGERRERRPGIGVGLAGMRERARQLGGRLEVAPGRTGQGTLVRAEFALAEER